MRLMPLWKKVLFASGDLGTYRNDMAIQLLGRKDMQVKLPGERVEVEEVEVIIGRGRGIARCAVLVYQDQLHAVVELDPEDCRPSSDDYQQWCLDHLPERLTRKVLFVTQMALTTSNKLDRQAVMREFKGMRLHEALAPDSVLKSEAEGFITSLITQSVGCQPKAPKLPLQYFGLNSMRLLQLRASVAGHYDAMLTFAQIRAANSISSPGQLVEGLLESPRNPSLCRDSDVAEEQLLPASDAQFAVWMAQDRYTNATYNVGRVL